MGRGTFCTLFPHPLRLQFETNERSALRKEAEEVLKKKDSDSSFRVYVLDPDEVHAARSCICAVVLLFV